MKKRFWKWNAVLSFLAWIWMSVGIVVLSDGEGPTYFAGLPAIPFMMAIWSLLTVTNNRKKPDDAIVGLNYTANEAAPKKLLWHILQERVCVALSYSLAIGLPFRYISALNDHLQFWLMLGTFLLGAAYILYAIFDYAKKLRELEG